MQHTAPAMKSKSGKICPKSIEIDLLVARKVKIWHRYVQKVMQHTAPAISVDLRPRIRKIQSGKTMNDFFQKLYRTMSFQF